MNIIRTATAALLAICFAGLCLAQGRIATERSAETYAAAVSTKATANTTTATGNSEVFQNILIAAGKTYPITSTLDYTTASTVAITVECSICTTAATSLGSSGLILQAAWAVPNAVGYVVAENKAATAFAYTDAGSALFNVYGSEFRLILQNSGTQTISIQQITFFQRGQTAAGN
jgi:hypothetical protein